MPRSPISGAVLRNGGESTSEGTSHPRHLTHNEDAQLQTNGFIQLNTHDVSLVEEHIPSIEKFADDLQTAINAAWPTRRRSRYDEVHVLLLSWEDDNLGVEEEIRRLGHVFLHLYQFDVQEFQIPRKTPGKATVKRISEFLENDGTSSLFIVYYAGHSRVGSQPNEAPIWQATNKPGSPTLPSSSVQQLFEEAESDVLLLYDSCHSSHPAVDISGQGVTEVIAACGFETETPIPGPHSFTNALIQVLEEVFTGPPISVAELHSRVLRELKNWKPSYLRDRSGHILIDPKTGRPKYECPKRRTPVHCFLTNETPYRSIMLAPLQTRLSHAAVGSLEEPRDRQNLSQSSLARSSPDDSRKEVASTAPTTISGSSNANKGPQVLLAVRLEDDGFLGGFEEDGGQRLRKWCDWLKVIPEGVKDISIQGVYKSFSTLVLMSMPVVLWNTLPDNPAYSFIGFVTSTNMAPQRFEKQAVEVKETTRNATKKTFDGIIPTLIPNPPLVAETKQIAPKAKVHQKFVETERILITNQARDALKEEGPRLQALDRKPTPLIAASQRPTKISVDAPDRTRPPPVVPFEGPKGSNIGASRRPRSLDISRSNIPERSLSDATQRPRSLDISRSEVPARSLSDASRQRDPLMKVIRRRPASILRQKPIDIGQFSDTISSSKELENRSRQTDTNNVSEHSERPSSHPKPHPPLPQEYQSKSSYPVSTTAKPSVSEQTSMKTLLRPPLPVLEHPFPPSQPLPKLPIAKRDPSSTNDYRRRLSTSTKAAREMLAPKHMLRKEKGDRLLYGEYCKPRATEGDFYEAKTGGYWGMSNVA